MRSILWIALLVLGSVMTATSCSNDSGSTPAQEDVLSSEDLDVAEDFNFRTAKEVEISLQVLGFDQTPLRGVGLTLYDGNPAVEGRELSSGATDQDGIYDTSTQLNSFVTELYLVSRYGTTVIPVAGNRVDYILYTAN